MNEMNLKRYAALIALFSATANAEMVDVTFMCDPPTEFEVGDVLHPSLISHYNITVEQAGVAANLNIDNCGDTATVDIASGIEFAFKAQTELTDGRKSEWTPEGRETMTFTDIRVPRAPSNLSIIITCDPTRCVAEIVK